MGHLAAIVRLITFSSTRSIKTDVSEALDDMLFSGGRLNISLPGGAGAEIATEV